MRESFDLIGVGLGPFNLGLAALLEPTELDGLFLDESDSFHWHEGMLIEGTTLEVPFLADLVTLADPTNPYSYCNYLREHDRIYEFYFYETFQIPRREYDDYLRWTATSLDSPQFDRRVMAIDYEPAHEQFVVTAVSPSTGDRYEYVADDVVVGVGTTPQLPDGFRGHPASDVFHTASYRSHIGRCVEADSITVVGSGQSAAEVFLDLLDRQPAGAYRLDWLTRSAGFFPMEYSKLGLQHFTPEYTQYVTSLSQETRDELIPEQDLLYKGIDVETSAAIYELLYERSIGCRDPAIGLLAETAVQSIDCVDDGYRLHCNRTLTDESFVHESDVVVCGTGYERARPAFYDPLVDRIATDDQGRFAITADYRLPIEDVPGRLFVQNAELHTHGVGTPDLGLGCYRNSRIANQLLGRTEYPEDSDTVFQDFSLEAFLERTPASTRRTDDEQRHHHQ